MPLGLDFTQIFLHLFNVLILFAGMYYLLYGPVKKFMEQREEHYRQMDEEKENALNQAREIQAEYEEKIHKVEQEIEEERKRASQEMIEFRQAKTKEAEEEARVILEKASDDAWKKRNAILDGTKDDIYNLIDHATDKLLLDGTTNSFYDAFLEDAERSVDE